MQSTGKEARMTERKAIVYTQPGCYRETTFLAQKGVEFEEKLVRMGSQATPRTVIDCKILSGFDWKQARS
jgi:hypothetical protein